MGGTRSIKINLFLEIVEEIREIGERSGTSVVKPTEIIASILDVFEKMCKHALVDMETKGGVDESLEKFQCLMEERLRKLKAYEMEKAEEILKQAFDLLGRKTLLNCFLI